MPGTIVGTRGRQVVSGMIQLSLACGCSAQGHTIRGVVPAEWPAGLLMPVEVPLPESLRIAEPARANLNRMSITVRIGSNRPTSVPADLSQTDLSIHGQHAILRFLLKLEQSDLGQPIEITVADRPGKTAAVACKATYESPFLRVTTAEDKPILSYWHGPPDSNNAKHYPLNDFIHPLIGLDGETLTAQSPGDHVHHRGIFWPWVRTERQGKWKNEWWIPRDFVDEPGRLEFDSAGATSCRFTAEHFWTYHPAEPARSERFVREVVECTVYRASPDGRAMDLDLTLTAIEDGIRIGGQTDLNKGYGGMTCRFGSATDVRMENDQGLIQSTSLNHVVAKWVDWTGLFVGPDGKRLLRRSGAALMVHPAHPSYPPEWIVRAYGPIGLAYPGLRMIELAKGKPLHLRYRFWIHRGGAVEGRVPEAYRAYCADWRWKTGP
jgi:hypothetical protein